VPQSHPFFSSPRRVVLGGLVLFSLIGGAPSLVSPARADDVAERPKAPAQGWQAFKEKRGVSVERRPVTGSKFFEYRASFSSSVAPERIIAELWNRVMSANNPVLKKRQVLKQDPSEILLYDQIKTPVVSDRDYTLRVRKVADPASHRYKMTFETANDLGPPVDPKYVRIPAIRGGWSVEPDDKGGSRLTYQTFSEPGGSIPSFMIHGAQFDQCVNDVERVQEMLKKM
jgi:hypothetical protein